MNIRTNILIGSSFALALAIANWSPLQAEDSRPVAAGGPRMTSAQLAECCTKAQTLNRELAAEVTRQDEVLTRRVADLNRSPADLDLARIAGVVTLIAEQRIHMDVRRAALQDELAQHMLQHVQAGGDSVPMCPMMKGADKPTDKPIDPPAGK